MIRTLLRKLPGYQRLRDAVRGAQNPDHANLFLKFSRPGHFYSPIPDLAWVEQNRARLFDTQARTVDGIDIREDAQLALLAELSRHYDELPFGDTRTNGLRYSFDNTYFCHADAIVLYGMLRHFRPARVIEVGSGHSSAVMLDTNDRFLEQKSAFTFIEPYPERLQSLLSEADRQKHEVLVDSVQNIPAARYDALQAGDFLFVDSSHVVKIGSDVVHLLSAVLPCLRKGVIIHFHDIFWPFEYPEDWVRGGRAWNEAYVLKAFLQFNSHFRILLFNSYLGIHQRARLEQAMPLFLKNTGGSLWIEKIA